MIVNATLKNIINGFLVFVLLISIMTWLFFFFRGLEQKETSIDRLSSGLYEIRILLPQSAEITLLTNMDSAHETELLAQTQFLLAPRLVVTGQPGQYFLLVEDPSLPGKKIEGDLQICSVHKDILVYALLKMKN